MQCTTPQFATKEAGQSSSAAGSYDAGGSCPVEASDGNHLPSWAEPLLGTYAMRSDYFAKNEYLTVPVVQASSEIMRAELKVEDGQLVLHTTTCAWRTRLQAIGLSQRIDVQPADALPRVSGQSPWATTARGRLPPTPPRPLATRPRRPRPARTNHASSRTKSRCG